MNKVKLDCEISERTLVTIGILCFNAEKNILDAKIVIVTLKLRKKVINIIL